MRKTRLILTLVAAIAAPAAVARAEGSAWPPPPPAPPPPAAHTPTAPLNVGFRLAMMFPIGEARDESDYASGLDLTYWHVGDGYVLEPRLGFRVDADLSQDGGWKTLAADVAIYSMQRLGGGALFVGGGAGVRHFSERTYETIRTGTVLVVEHELLHQDSAFAPAVFARVGLVSPKARPDQPGRLVIAFDVEAAYATLNGRSYPRSFQLSLGSVF